MLELAKVLKITRINHGLNQEQFAQSLDVTKTYISLIENNKTEPSFSLIKNFSKRYKIPLWLILWENFETSENATQADKEIKNEIEKMMPKLKEYYFDKLSGADVSKLKI